MSVLMAAPFNLQSGASVYASIECYNSIGNSPTSGVGNGAKVVISTVPNSPTNLARSLIVSLDMT